MWEERTLLLEDNDCDASVLLGQPSGAGDAVKVFTKMTFKIFFRHMKWPAEKVFRNHQLFSYQRRGFVKS